MKKFFAWLKNEESGQGMVEYALIIAVVAVLLVSALVVFRTQIAAVFTSIQTAISGATTPPAG